jgi:soluble lytic murein transglycosylase-like protein
VLAFALVGCSPRDGDAPAELPSTPEARREVWAAIQPLAAARHIDPLFVYAMVKAESNFDPHATRGDGKGLMQVKPRAWRSVTRLPYESMVWNWRTNLAVGIEHLAALRDELTAKGTFSYPLLWASYDYGIDYVAEHRYEMSWIPRPSDPIADKLRSGVVHPMDPPK